MGEQSGRQNRPRRVFDQRPEQVSVAEIRRQLALGTPAPDVLDDRVGYIAGGVAREL